MTNEVDIYDYALDRVDADAEQAAVIRQPLQSREPDEYETVFKEMDMDSKRAALSAVRGSLNIDPNRYAKLKPLAERNNVPTRMLLGSQAVEKLESQQLVKDADVFLDQFPNVRQFLKDPDNATLTYDDLGALQKVGTSLQRLMEMEQNDGVVENLVDILADLTPANFKRSATGAQLALDDVLNADSYSDLEIMVSAAFSGFGGDPVAGAMMRIVANQQVEQQLAQVREQALSKLTRRERAAFDALSNDDQRQYLNDNWKTLRENTDIWAQREQRLADISEIDREIEQIRARGPDEGLGFYAYETAAAATRMAPSVAAGFVNPTLGATLIYSDVWGARYAQARTAGREEQEAFFEATFFAAIEGISERIPLGLLTKPLKPGSSRLARIGQTSLAESAQELFVEMVDIGYSIGILDESVTITEAAERLRDAGILGFTTGGTLSITTNIPGAALDLIRGQRERDRADQFKETLTEAQKQVQETQTMVRSPETMREVLKGLSDQEFVYAEASELMALEQSGVLTLADLTSLGVDTETFAEMQRGGDVEIDLGRLLTMPTDKFNALSSVIRETISAMSTKEAKQALEDRQELITQLITQAEEARDQGETVDLIVDPVSSQLRGMGFTEKEARQKALLVRETYETRVSNMEGVTADQLFAEEHVQIRRPQPQRGEQQAPPADVEMVYEQANATINETGEITNDTWLDAEVPPLEQVMSDYVGQIKTETNPVSGKSIGPVYRPVAQADIPKKTRKVYKLMKTLPSKPGMLFPLFAKPQGEAQGYTIEEWYLAESQRPKLGGKELALRPGIHAVARPVFDQGKANKKGERRVWVEVEVPDIDPAVQDESDSGTVLPNGMLAGVTERLIGPNESYDYKTNPNASTDAGGWPIAGSMKPLRIVPDSEVTAILTGAGLENQIDNSMTTLDDATVEQMNTDLKTVADGVNSRVREVAETTAADTFQDPLALFQDPSLLRGIPDTSPAGGLTEKSFTSVGDLEGAWLYPIFADLTDSGTIFDQLDGVPVAPTIYLGGPNYSWLKNFRDSGIVWAVGGRSKPANKSVGTKIVNAVRALRERSLKENGTGRVIVTVMAMKDDAHTSNNMTTSALLRTLDGFVAAGRIPQATLDQAAEHLRSKSKKKDDGYKELANFPGFTDAKKLHDWLTTATFPTRKAVATELRTAAIRDLPGMFAVERIVREAVDPEYRATQLGDALLAFEIDPDDPDTIVDFDDPNYKGEGHPTYRYGIKGKLVGSFKTHIPMEVLYKDILAKRVAASKPGSHPKFLLDRMPTGEGQLVTPEIVRESEVIEGLNDYRIAHAWTAALGGDWATSLEAKNAGGIAPIEFQQALRENSAAATLTPYTTKDVEKGAKAAKADPNDGMVVYKLGKDTVGKGGLNTWFAIKRHYDYMEEYGGPVVEQLIADGIITNDEVALVGVANNELGVGGLGTFQVLKAVEEGVTVLDAFKVVSKDKPFGLLPTIYATLGFEEVGQIEFDPQYLPGKTQAEKDAVLDDLVAIWERQGWVPDTVDETLLRLMPQSAFDQQMLAERKRKATNFPEVAIMKWRGTEDARSNATENFVRKGLQGLGSFSLGGDASIPTISGVLRDQSEGGDGSERGGDADGRATPARMADRAGGLANAAADYIRSVLRADALAIKALKLPQDRIDAIRRKYADLLEAAPEENIRAQIARQLVPTDEQVLNLLGGFPNYLRGVATAIVNQRNKLVQGQITHRDVMKAYAITVVSQGAGAQNLSTFTKNTGFVPDPTYVERNMLRPEEMAAMWLSTANGQAALDAAEQGNYDPALWQELIDWRKSYGRPQDTIRMFEGEEKRLKRTGELRQGQMRTTKEITDRVNNVGLRIGKQEAGIDELVAELTLLTGIAEAKGPFMAHLLGLGGQLTMDAVEMNYWLTGQGDVGKLEASKKAFKEQVEKDSKMKTALREEVTDRLQAMIEDGRIKMPKEITPDMAMHIMHHWIWDRAKGIETTHKGMYQTMALYQDEGLTGLDEPAANGRRSPIEYAQQESDPAGPKGQFYQQQTLKGDINYIIELTENANRSTFLHEFGHFWIFQMQKDLKDPRLTPQGRARLEKQMAKTKQWFRDNAKDAWRDIQIMERSAKEAARKDPSSRSKAERARILEAAVSRAKRGGGDIYMAEVADNFMNGTMEHGTALEMAFHELWARGAERYLGEGKAPSATLREAFSDFSTWLIGIYKKLTNLNVKISDDVRDVFDRLLATDEAINEERNRTLYQVPADILEQATPAERKELERLAQEATREAKAQMQGRVSKELAREATEAYKEAIKGIRDRITEEVRQEPLYAALRILKLGILPDGTEMKTPDGKPSKPFLGYEELVALYGEDIVKKIPKGLVAKKSKNTMSPQALARLSGFDSAGALIEALTTQHLSERQKIDAKVEQEKSAKYDSIVNADRLADEAAEVVTNERMTELMALQARILRRLAGPVMERVATRQALEEGAPMDAAADRAAVEDARRAEGAAPTAEDAVPEQLRTQAAEAQQAANRPQRRAQRAAANQIKKLTRAMDVDAIKAAALQFVQRTPYEKLSPGRYRQTADRLARKAQVAIAKRDYEAAADLLQQRTMNLEIARQATLIRDKVDSRVTRFRRLLRRSDKDLRGSYDIDLVTAARLAMEPYGLYDLGRDRRNLDPRAAMERLRTDYPQAAAEADAMVSNLTAQIGQYMERRQGEDPWKAVPSQELLDTFKQFEALLSNARDATSVLLEGRRVKHDDIGGEMRDFTAEIATGDGEGIGRGTEAERTRINAIGTLSAAMNRVESYARLLDGGRVDGPFTTYVVRPVQEAIGKYLANKNKPIEALLKVLTPYKGQLAAEVNITATELDGYVFRTKGELLHAVLHTGNESNKRKLLLGGAVDVKTGKAYTFATETDDGLDTSRWDAFVNRMISTGVLTKADFDLAQQVWDILEGTKAAAQTAHHRMYGHYFDEIEAAPLQTPFGEYRGGYVPAIADSMMTADAAARLDAEVLTTQGNAAMFPRAQDGFTKSRTNVTEPLNLDLNLLPSHLDRVMKFSYLAPVVRQTALLLKNKKVASAIHKVNPQLMNWMFIPWLSKVASQSAQSTNKFNYFNGIAKAINRNVGLQLMAGNVVNALQQVTGLSSAMAAIKPKYLFRTIGKARIDRMSAVKYVAEASPYMRNRMIDSMNDVGIQVDEILNDTNLFKKGKNFAAKYGYFAQTLMQNMVDAPVWLAAEEQFRGEGHWQRVFTAYADMGVETATRKADAAAVLYADQLVRETQTAMSAADISAVEGGHPLWILAMKFYSYFNSMYNLNRTEFLLASREMGWRHGMGRMFYLYLFGIAIPAIGAQAITMAFKGGFDDIEDKDEDEMAVMLWELLGLSQMQFVAGFLPGGNQLVSAAYGQFTDVQYDDRLTFSPVISVGGDALGGVGRLLEDSYMATFGDDEVRDLRPMVRDAMNVIGISLGLPTGWLRKPTEYLIRVNEGDSDPEGVIDWVQGITRGRDGTEDK